jgi:[ribosomal protein S5]-alanine N-acetyltransferase
MEEKIRSLGWPTLEAGDYRLRPFDDADLDMIREASTDPHIPAITSVPVAYTDESGRRFLELQRDPTRPVRALALAERDTDRAIGGVALVLRDLDEGRASIGYFVVPSARGRGAAARGLVAMARWASSGLHIPRIQVYIEPWNIASIRTAEAAGFTQEGLLRGWQVVNEERRDMLMYSLLAADLEP